MHKLMENVKSVYIASLYTHCLTLLHNVDSFIRVSVGTMLGPYGGKTVNKEHMEGETHEWLWEVSAHLSVSLAWIAITWVAISHQLHL